MSLHTNESLKVSEVLCLDSIMQLKIESNLVQVWPNAYQPTNIF